MNKRKSQPTPVREIISKVLHQKGLTRTVAHRAVFDAWGRIAPETIALRSKPISYRAGKLLVAVSSAPLLEELRSFRSGEFLNLLNDELSRDPDGKNVVVNKVEFRRA